MLSRSEAIASAASFLESAYPDKSDSLVLFPEKCVEHDFGWVVAFDFKEHLETGDWLLSPITSVVIVPHTGEKAHFPPSAFPVDDYLNRRASGDWPPKE